MATRKPRKRQSGPSGPHTLPGFLLRYSPEQRARWQTAADLDGRALTDWMRRALDRVAAEWQAGERR